MAADEQSAPLAVDFGTCYSSAALLIDGHPRAVPVDRQPSVPSTVLLNKHGELLVGVAAERQKAARPDSYQEEFKRVLGSREKLLLGDREMAAEDLVSKVLAFVKRAADEATGEHPRGVVTVPASYEQHRCGLMLKAAQRAGFEEVRLLQEPVAAALARPNGVGRDDELVFVYDLGGGTFDAALVKFSEGDVAVLGFDGLDDVGGANFDRAIERDLAVRAGPALATVLEGLDSDDSKTWRRAKRAELMARDFCEDIKHDLSQVEHTDSVLPLGDDEIDYELSRADLERMVADDLDRTFETCARLIDTSGYQAKDLDAVLMIGGSCHLPFIGERLERAFGQRPERVLAPELAVCYGAARWAELDGAASNTVAKPPVDPPREDESEWERVTDTARSALQGMIADDEEVKLLDACERSTGTKTAFLLTGRRLLYCPTQGVGPVKVIHLGDVSDVRRSRERIMILVPGRGYRFERFQQETPRSVALLLDDLVLAQQSDECRRELTQRREDNLAAVRSSSAWKVAGERAKTAALDECNHFEIVTDIARVTLTQSPLAAALVLVTNDRLVVIEDDKAESQPAMMEVRNHRLTELGGRHIKNDSGLASVLGQISQKVRSPVSKGTPPSGQAPEAKRKPKSKSTPKPKSPRASKAERNRSRIAKDSAWSATHLELRDELLTALYRDEELIDVARCGASPYFRTATLLITDRRVLWSTRKVLGDVVLHSARYNEISDLKGGFFDNKLIFTAKGVTREFYSFQGKKAATFVAHVRERLPVG